MNIAEDAFTALIVVFQTPDAPFAGSIQRICLSFYAYFMHSVSECYACVVVLALSEFEFGEGNS